MLCHQAQKIVRSNALKGQAAAIPTRPRCPARGLSAFATPFCPADRVLDQFDSVRSASEPRVRDGTVRLHVVRHHVEGCAEGVAALGEDDS